MKQFLLIIFYVEVGFVKFRNRHELVLASYPRRVIDLDFIASVILFITAVIIKANFNSILPALLLGFAAFKLFSCVWRISGNAMVVFDKNDSNVYRIYKHLGYMQKIYITPMASVISCAVSQQGKSASLVLQLDNQTELIISKQNIKRRQQLESLAREIQAFMAD